MRQMLSNQYRTFKASVLTSAPNRHKNLNIEKTIHGSSISSDYEAVLDLLRTQVAARNYAQVAAEIKALESNQLRLANGTPLYIYALDVFTDQISEGDLSIQDCEALIPEYKAWHDSAPDCPYAAAIYATVLGHVGYRYRGTGWAKSVTREGWEKLQEYGAKGRAIFDASRAAHSHEGVWALQFLRYSNVEGCRLDEIMSRYVLARAKLPMTPSVHDFVAYMLLPRWHGDYEKLEKFISGVAADHQAHFGDALYARLYTYVADFEDTDDLHMDRARFARGAKEWLKHFPSQYYQTELAATAYLAHDYELTLDLLEGLRDFHFEAFETGLPLQTVNSICLEFTGR